MCFRCWCSTDDATNRTLPFRSVAECARPRAQQLTIVQRACSTHIAAPEDGRTPHLSGRCFDCLISGVESKRRPTPPYNPGVRTLVRGKREMFRPVSQKDLRRGFRGWHENGYLPHRDEPGLIQFVTFHLADSFPANLRSEWEALLQLEDDHERRRKIEAYLDKGLGECHLRDERIASLVDGAIRFY